MTTTQQAIAIPPRADLSADFPRRTWSQWTRWAQKLCPAWIFWLVSKVAPWHCPLKGDSMRPFFEDSIPTRQSLLHRLRNWDDSTSWKEFFDTYWKLIYGVARAAGLTEAEAQDVVQETILAVAKKIPDFTYDPAAGSFKAWLKQLTRWRIHDHLRKKCYEKDGRWLPREHRADTDQLSRQLDPAGYALEQVWDQEWERTLMETALKKIRQRADPLQYQMFYLHVIKRLPAREVALRLEVKLSDVYFAKYKLSALVKKEVRALENTLV